MDWTFFFLILFCLDIPLLCGYGYWCARHSTSRTYTLLATTVLAICAFGLLGWEISNHYTGDGINAATFAYAPQGISGLRWHMALPISASALGVAALVVFVGRRLWRAAQVNAQRANGASKLKSKTIAVLFPLGLLALNPGSGQTTQVLFEAWQAKRLVANVMEGAQLPAPPPAAYRRKPVSAIYIYAEGLEATFLDNTRFPGLMPQLDALGKQGLRIRGIHQVTLTGWTIAGQTASNCGFPGSQGDTQFVDNPTQYPCVGDLLASDGYALSYLNGSSLAFEGKGTFWSHHGYHRLLGDKDILALADTPDAPMSEWGAYDDTLMTAAWNEYQRLLKQRDASGQPFVLTMLTVDTHAPDGMDTPACRTLQMPDSAKEHFTSAMHCADHVIGGFIARVLADLPDDVVVVLQSDHLQPPRNRMIAELGDPAQREDLWMAWSHSITAGELHRQATMFDAAPTFLGLLDRAPVALNLGRDLRGTSPTLAEQHGYAWVDRHMKAALADARLSNAGVVESERAKLLEQRLKPLHDTPNVH